jgi:hypothetical protein
VPWLKMGDALGRAGISIEGGGGFVFEGEGIVHFLFEDAGAARRALEAAGIEVLEDREVVVQRLKQEQPGQLGKISRLMAEAGVNIEAIYSDHHNQLIWLSIISKRAKQYGRRGKRAQRQALSKTRFVLPEFRPEQRAGTLPNRKGQWRKIQCGDKFGE